MDIKFALKGQYHAALDMLRDCITECPDEIWRSGAHPRSYWRIAYHTIFYAHLYLVQNEGAFICWEKHRESAPVLWADPPIIEPYSRQDTIAYLDNLISIVDSTVEDLNLEAEETGFDWYPNMGKLEHVLLSLRHIQGHVGQLSELLMAHSIDTRWISRRKPATEASIDSGGSAQ